MDNNWSRYIQTTEELYESRSLRFTDENSAQWHGALGARDGMRILEIGCAGGLFCHRIKTHLPNTVVTGLDFDTGHIEFARKKTIELGLDCTFENGDATAMPFSDSSFDLCYSYTVTGHIPVKPFLREQYRVLTPGGRVTVMSVRTKLNLHGGNWYIVGEAEKELSRKLWEEAEKHNPVTNMAAYEMREEEYPAALEAAGFRDVSVDFLTVTEYAPDSANVPDELALQQIYYNRHSSINSMEKALRMAPDALTLAEQNELRELIVSRYDERVRQYENGEKLWDFSNSTALVVSGYK